MNFFNELQKIALTQTRMKIPLLEDEEGTHGAMFPGATVFPEGLSVGSTFDLPLVNAIYAAAAQEARASGIQFFQPWCWRRTGIRVWGGIWRPTPKILTSTRGSRRT